MEGKVTFPQKKRKKKKRGEMLILWKVERVPLHGRKSRKIHARVEDGERFVLRIKRRE